MAGVLLTFLAIVGVLGLTNLSSSASTGTAMYRDATLPIEHLGDARAEVGNADTDLLRALRDTTGSSQSVAAVQHDLAALQSAMKDYASSALTGSERAAYDQYRSDFTRYQAVTATLLKDLQAGDAQSRAQAEKLYTSSAGPLNSKLDQTLNQITAINDREAAVGENALQANYSSSRTQTIVVLVLAIALGIGLAFVVTRLVRSAARRIIARLAVVQEKGVGDLVRGLDDLAQGDLSHRFETSTQAVTDFAGDELGQIERQVEEMRDALVAGKQAYNASADKLSALIGNVSTTAENVNEASKQMSATSEETGKASSEVAQAVTDIAQGAERQVQMVEHTRDTVEEVARAVERIGRERSADRRSRARDARCRP